MEKELTKAEKSRKTKLSKMTNEELIAIILRKDLTEHKFQNINKCLKENIIGLENKVRCIKVELEDTEQQLVNANEEVSRYKCYNEHNVEALKETHERNVKLSSLLTLFYVIITILAITTLGGIFVW